MPPELTRFSFFAPILAVPFALIFTPFFFSCVEDRHRERSLASALIESVLGILGARTMPQMLRIHASRIIAAMADFFPRRNRAFEFLENQSMRQSLSHLAILSPFDLSIAKLCAWVIRLARIVPARGFKIDFYPEEDPLPWLE